MRTNKKIEAGIKHKLDLLGALEYIDHKKHCVQGSLSMPSNCIVGHKQIKQEVSRNVGCCMKL